MKKIRIFATLVLMAVMSTSTMAQLSAVDFMRNNPRASFANPAFYTVDNGYFDLLLGGINFSLLNTGLKYDKFFRFDQQGYPVMLDLDKGVASLKDVNYLNTTLNFDIFNCGLRTKHGYFTYAHRLREMESVSYSKDMIQFLAQGNGAFMGASNPANFNIQLAARLFQEFDFGYQMSLMEQLNIGVRFKFLMGFADLKTNPVNMTVTTDPETYAMTITPGQMTVTGALPYQLEVGQGISIVDGRFNVANLFKNFGGGIDLGAEYHINDQWGVAAAVNDLGFISWSNNAVQLNAELQDGGPYYQDGSFVFSGLTSEQVNGLMHTEGYVDTLIGSFKDYFKMSVTPMAKYTTGLNTNLMVRGYYDITPEHRFSAQFTGYNMGLGIKPAMTIAYTGSFNKKYDVVATYTAMKGSFDNIGIGLSANFGGILLYAATNNLLGFFNPANISQLNLQLGISFTSGKTVDRSEMVIIKDKQAEAYEE